MHLRTSGLDRAGPGGPAGGSSLLHGRSRTVTCIVVANAILVAPTVTGALGDGLADDTTPTRPDDRSVEASQALALGSTQPTDTFAPRPDRIPGFDRLPDEVKRDLWHGWAARAAYDRARGAGPIHPVTGAGPDHGGPGHHPDALAPRNLSGIWSRAENGYPIDVLPADGDGPDVAVAYDEIHDEDAPDDPANHDHHVHVWDPVDGRPSTDWKLSRAETENVSFLGETYTFLDHPSLTGDVGDIDGDGGRELTAHEVDRPVVRDATTGRVLAVGPDHSTIRERVDLDGDGDDELGLSYRTGRLRFLEHEAGADPGDGDPTAFIEDPSRSQVEDPDFGPAAAPGLSGFETVGLLVAFGAALILLRRRS